MLRTRIPCVILLNIEKDFIIYMIYEYVNTTNVTAYIIGTFTFLNNDHEILLYTYSSLSKKNMAIPLHVLHHLHFALAYIMTCEIMKPSRKKGKGSLKSNS